MEIQKIVSLVQNHWLEIVAVYLAFIKFVTTLRDVIDKTPATDDNWFERIVTILNKLGSALLTGKRP